MRLPAGVMLIVALLGVVVAGQQSPPGGDAPRRPRLPVVLSDLLSHSQLAACHSHAGSRRPTPLRIATWNIRAARTAPVADIAAELAAMKADVMALQEVDVLTRRGSFVDQPAALATALGVHYVFAASIKWDDGDYGLALLSRFPLTAVERHRLAGDAAEPRIVLETTVCVDGRPLRLFNHHADGRAGSREAGFLQLNALVRPQVGRGIVVLGDFNERADAIGVRSLVEAGLLDLGAADEAATEGSGRIDYLFSDALLAAARPAARVWPTDKSDHNAVLADFTW